MTVNETTFDAGIRLDSLTHRYRGQDAPALGNVSLEIPSGSITGIVGPNGSGKTTLMRILAGHMFETSGTVSFGGAPIATDDRIPWTALAQAGEDFGENNIKEVVRTAAMRPTWDADLFAHLVERFRLEPLKGSAGKKSTGQKSMLTASIAMASGAPIVLFDEVHSGLDVPNRYAFYEELMSLGAEGDRTILVSSHLVGELERLVEHLVILEAGHARTTSVDAVRQSVHSLVGPAEAMEAATEGMHVLTRRQLGPTAEFVVEGSIDEAATSRFLAAGIEVKPLSFQDAFVAIVEENR